MIKKQEAHGPRHAHLSEIATADVIQHFPNPAIATNERIIIWAVLGFVEEELFLLLLLSLFSHIWAWQSKERDHLNKLLIPFQQYRIDMKLGGNWPTDFWRESV